MKIYDYFKPFFTGSSLSLKEEVPKLTKNVFKNNAELCEKLLELLYFGKTKVQGLAKKIVVIEEIEDEQTRNFLKIIHLLDLKTDPAVYFQQKDTPGRLGPFLLKRKEEDGKSKKRSRKSKKRSRRSKKRSHRSKKRSHRSKKRSRKSKLPFKEMVILY